MTQVPLIAPLVRKEIRALAPLWLSAVLILVSTGWMGDMVVAWALLAYAIAAVALGASSFGHEYSHHTLGVLLTQPVSRQRVLAVKFAVLGVMTGTLLAIAARVLLTSLDRPQLPADPSPAVALIVPALVGVTIAPLLTMLTRSTLAGLILSAAVPLLLVPISLIGVGWRFGFEGGWPPEAGAFGRAIATAGLGITCAASGAAAWWLFGRLQDLGGRPMEISIRVGKRILSADPATSPRARHPVMALLRKELRLQQGVMVISVLYATAAIGVALFARDPATSVGWIGELMVTLTIMHAAVVGLMAGALASAEERQLGMIEPQLLLPVSSLAQWAIKCAVLYGLVFALAAGLPLLISMLSPAPDVRRELGGFVQLQAIAPLFLATTAALYVSSMTSGGVRAFVASMPAIAGSMLIGGGLATVAGNLLSVPMARIFSNAFPALLSTNVRAVMTATALTLIAALALLVVRLALTNHRSADRSARRVGGHLALLVAAATVSFAIYNGLWRVYGEVILRR